MGAVEAVAFSRGPQTGGAIERIEPRRRGRRGGAAAGLFAGDNLAGVRGLLLWGSYPSNDLSTADALQVLSVSGSNDLLATPADINASKQKLPPLTTFLQITGGVHAFFGDYGEQPGDGQPGIDRSTASAQISAATVAFLGRLR